MAQIQPQTTSESYFYVTVSPIPMNLGYIVKAREVAALAAHIASAAPPP